MTNKFWTSIWFGMTCGLVMRLALMLYGLWQDSTMEVKYTDVDYFVFTDAAEFVAKGESPYKRSTYRYTPLLAWILQPNITWTPLFGKVIFIICDLVTGYLIYVNVKRTSLSSTNPVFCAETWLLNPLPMTVSSRGNAESIMSMLVLATIYVLGKVEKENRYRHVILAGILYGVSVHTKIYPVTYALAVYLFLNDVLSVKCHEKNSLRDKIHSVFGVQLLPNWTCVIFILAGGITLVTLTGLCYLWCGAEFIQETYLYHITRKDTRHNFSPYFYMLYLLGNDSSPLIGIAAFMPQLVLLLSISFKFHGDLPFCCFLQTFVFVTFNKVCTSQYFLWYISLLPLILSQLMFSGGEALFLICLWFAGQGVWLAPAYFLEFVGENTFFWIWIAGFVFFLTNIWIIHRIIQMYTYGPKYQSDKTLGRKDVVQQNLRTAFQISRDVYYSFFCSNSKINNKDE